MSKLCSFVVACLSLCSCVLWLFFVHFEFIFDAFVSLCSSFLTVSCLFVAVLFLFNSIVAKMQHFLVALFLCGCFVCLCNILVCYIHFVLCLFLVQLCLYFFNVANIKSSVSLQFVYLSFCFFLIVLHPSWPRGSVSWRTSTQWFQKKNTTCQRIIEQPSFWRSGVALLAVKCVIKGQTISAWVSTSQQI